ncbi:DegT/DnrJ/EryC1/StrS family aminotransferase [Candidatus Halobonum tyrrellensis]|uniref:DegT/DnrJ/EryC1/StrS aminotransferase n=1 Tax=Candidatus Halobonum tyrrellensis G22 TaxID=1324957 RepID=V4HGJ2_9EURY|nr:DegT/DnrJ/EryC1/StrS family aminotransferase [Candidatus Halobonum tyrrellensis]ESP86924.1 DegT/DnrJ/EryC1/StrS aminotransferase [Candidatus Halobonum tyrrellensis G22]
MTTDGSGDRGAVGGTESGTQSAERVSFTDVRVDEEAVEAAVETLRSGRYVKGPRVETFESAFADATGVDHARAVSSGSAALALALRAVGVGEGDEVFLPGHTFFASAASVLDAGATPVFVDIDPETYTIDPDDLRAAVEASDAPAAVMPVHLYGQMADMHAVGAVADEYDLRVVEDAAQAHGADRDGLSVGDRGDAACFSFYPTKNLTVAGEGGMVVADDGAVADRVARLRDHGRDESGAHVVAALNHRMSEVSAAVGHAELDRLESITAGRRAAALAYDDGLADVDAVRTPVAAAGARHVYHLYVVRVPDRAAFRATLDDCGVDTAVHYETPAHRQPALPDGVGGRDLPETAAAVDEIVSLPMHADLSEAEVDRVCDAVREHYA